MKYNTITKAVAETVPGGLYEGIDYHGTPPADVAARAGWVDVTPEIQAQLDADAAAAQAESDALAAAPMVQDRDMEFVGGAAPILAGNPTDTAGYRLAAAEVDDGVAVVVAVKDHGSPKRDKATQRAEAKGRGDAIRAGRAALRAARTDKARIDALEQIVEALTGGGER